MVTTVERDHTATPGEPEIDRPALEGLVGRVIEDRYRLDAVLGIGGTGAVFRAHQLALKRDVALKILHPDLTRNERVFRRFQREAASTARLEHPNIVSVMEAGSTSDGHHFIVMQLLEGVELHDLLAEAVSPHRAAELMLQVFRGLEHAHQRGVVHRDLKPENVRVTTDHEGREVLKLVDFGLAKLLEGEPGADALTRMGMVFGTPGWMSPEQASGRPVDARTDLYSAGLIFYGLLAGRPPFLEDDPVELVRAQIGRPPPPLPPHVPAPLAQLVLALLAKDPAQRPAGAAQVRALLEQLLPALPDRIGGSRMRRLGGWKAIVAVAAAAGALAFAAAAVAGSGEPEPTPEPEPVPAPPPVETAPAPAPAPASAPPSAPRAGPDPTLKPTAPAPAVEAPAAEAKKNKKSSSSSRPKKKKRKRLFEWLE